MIFQGYVKPPGEKQRHKSHGQALGFGITCLEGAQPKTAQDALRVIGPKSWSSSAHLHKSITKPHFFLNKKKSTQNCIPQSVDHI